MINKTIKHITSYNLKDFTTAKKSAFTLAEVLITLGIIGVVAAMTIPTLMVDINTKQWKTAANVFEKKLNEAMKSMNTAQVISGHPNTLSFVNELGKHFKINKICKNNELQNCFSDTVWWGAGEGTPEEVDMKEITQASHFGLQDWGTELIGVQFANGVAGLVAYNPKCSGDPYSNQFKGTDCISMLYDTSGNKNPNTSGKDLGNYGVIKQLGDATCAFEINGACFSTPFRPAPHAWNACDQNGTSTDPEDLAYMSKYGISYCLSSQYYNTDYYAGAAEACGGVSKMPTAAHLAAIANYVYGTTNIGADTMGEEYTMNTEKALSLGFTFGALGMDDTFVIWGQGEDLANASYRMYLSMGTAYMEKLGHRCNNDFYAVCINN